MYEGGFAQCLKDKQLELNFTPSAIAFAPLTLVRAAVFAKRFDLNLGPKLTAFIGKQFKACEKRLVATQMGYYGREIISLSELKAVLTGKP